MAGAALGQEVPVKGCCPGSAFPDTAPCPSHRRPPQQGTAGASRVVRHGEKEREKETGRGRPVLPPRLLWRVTGRG